MRNSIIKGYYRHYKGNEYEVIGEAVHTESEEKLIIYRSLKDSNDVWARPYDMFFETVIVGEKEVPRFAKIDTQ
jgi:hypothetical protein